MAFSYSNNNLSKKLFVKIGDTSNGNHSQIDQIADFYGITWVNSNYNSTFGGQWCFIDSTIIDNSGPYAMQRIMSCENATVLATRYCTKGTWGAWNVGVTKSDLAGYSIKTLAVSNRSLLSSGSSSRTKFSIDTGLAVNKDKIVPLRFECTNRYGWMPTIWYYLQDNAHYLVNFGSDANGQYGGILVYLEKS